MSASVFLLAKETYFIVRGEAVAKKAQIDIGVSVDINVDIVKQKFADSVQQVTNLTLKQAQIWIKDQYVKEKRWIWPRDTKRKKNGRKKSRILAAGPRDIYDLGNLLKGVDFTKAVKDGDQVNGTIFCGVPYAGLVETGYVTAAGTVVPPRPFISEGLREFNFQKRFSENLKNFYKGRKDNFG